MQPSSSNIKNNWLQLFSLLNENQQLTTTANISWCLHFYWFLCEMISWEQAQKFHTDDVWEVLVVGRATRDSGISVQVIWTQTLFHGKTIDTVVFL